MAKPEWGTKRTCPGCDARFYDLNKHPATCPICDTVIEVQTAKPRKPAPAPKAAPKPVVAEPTKSEESTDDDLGDDLDAVVLDVDDDEEDDDSLIEDTSDLAENDGMDEVKDHMETDISDDS